MTTFKGEQRLSWDREAPPWIGPSIYRGAAGRGWSCTTPPRLSLACSPPSLDAGLGHGTVTQELPLLMGTSCFPVVPGRFLISVRWATSFEPQHLSLYSNSHPHLGWTVHCAPLRGCWARRLLVCSTDFPDQPHGSAQPGDVTRQPPVDWGLQRTLKHSPSILTSRGA